MDAIAVATGSQNPSVSGLVDAGVLIVPVLACGLPDPVNYLARGFQRAGVRRHRSALAWAWTEVEAAEVERGSPPRTGPDCGTPGSALDHLDPPWIPSAGTVGRPQHTGSRMPHQVGLDHLRDFADRTKPRGIGPLQPLEPRPLGSARTGSPTAFDTASFTPHACATTSTLLRSFADLHQPQRACHRHALHTDGCWPPASTRSGTGSPPRHRRRCHDVVGGQCYTRP